MFSPNSFIYGSSCELVDDVVGEQHDGHNQEVNGVGILVPALLVVLEEQGSQHAGGRRNQQNEERQLAHTGDVRQEVARQEAGFLNRHDDAHHAFPPGNAHDERRFLYLATQLQHGVDAGLGGKGQVFHHADERENGEGAIERGNRAVGHDGNGKVNSSDSLLILQVATGQKSF